MKTAGKSFASLPTRFSSWRAVSRSRPLAKSRDLFYSVRTAFSVVIASAALLVLQSAQAANIWDGGGADANWGTVNNWDNNAAPSYGTLSFRGAVRPSSNNNSITNMNSLFFQSATAFTIGGNALNLFDNGGTQAKIENNGNTSINGSNPGIITTGLATINLATTFAANNGSPPNPFGEINAVTGDITFGSGTLTVNGSSVNGIKLFGGGHVVTFNNTVSAVGKWFGITTGGTGNTINIGGSFTSSDFYVMNDGTLNLNSGGSLTTSVRLGGDFGNTGNQNLTKSGTFNLTPATGGVTFPGVVNSVTGNTSGTLAVNSQNTSGTNTLSGHIALDSELKITQAAAVHSTLRR
jgi:hypothetical protein